jgi:hypothetical protein
MMPLAMSSGEIETSGYSHPMVRLRSSSRVGFWPCQTARERTSYSVRFGASTLVRADQTVEQVTRRVARRLFQRVLERCYRRLIKTARTSENRREAVFPFRAGANFRYWHKADNPTAPTFVRYWSNSGHAWHWR